MENAIKGSITISRPSYGDGRKKITIEIMDRNAVTRFLDIEIDYDKFAELVTGLSSVDCDFTVRGLDRVGKTRESKTLEFPFKHVYTGIKESAYKEALKQTPEGWECSSYFSSQTSFFTKDDEDYARTNITRWI